MPCGTRWAWCCNSVWHGRGLQAGKELSLPRLSCQNHLFSFVQCSSTLPRPVFLRTALWGLKDKKIQPKKRQPWINEIKGNVVRFYIPTFHITENVSKPTRMFFCCQTLPRLALQNAKRLGLMLERVFLFLFQRGRSQTEPRPGVPGQMSCQHAKDAEPSLLLLSAARWAAALHHPPRPSRRDHEVGLKSTFLQFHVFIYGLRNVVWGCIFHGGAGFLTTLQEFIFTAATHPISLQDFQEQRAGPNHLFCVDLTQNGANQRKERSPNFYSSIQVPLKLLLGSPPTSCWDLSRREEGREEKQEEDAMSLRTS